MFFIRDTFDSEMKESERLNNNKHTNKSNGCLNDINIDEDKRSSLVNIQRVFYLAWYKLCFELFDKSISNLMLTTPEKINLTIRSIFYKLASFLFWMVLSVLFFPAGVIIYFVWFLIFRKLLRTRPYELSVVKRTNAAYSVYDDNRTFELFSLNVCLLPEAISKANNLINVKRRLNTIGRLLNKTIDKNYHHKTMRKCYTNLCNDDCLPTDSHQPLTTGADRKRRSSKSPVGKCVDVRIIDDFLDRSDPDFVCLQEVWINDYETKLVELLHERYEYIIYDVGLNRFDMNRYVGFDSGLVFASKYPIVNADFKQYSVKVGLCSLTGKGLLMVKVNLGKHKSGKTVVGYVANTHLQAYQEKSHVHSFQMSEILIWMKKFKDDNFDSEKEIIAFDILSGDLNNDNMSPADSNSYEHELFKKYVDPLSIEPGIDHPLAVGTEMRLFSIYDSFTSTPAKFKQALENERLRRWFLLDANIEFVTSQMVKEIPDLDKDGVPTYLPKYGGKRRIDRILHSKKTELDVLEYNFITNFVRLTDHIPISMKFKCKL